jgi:ATP-dependent protease ClpP protease subunit
MSELDTVYVKPSPQNFAYFIDGDIEEASKYRELMQILISMSEGDTLELMINCFGGYLHTTTMLSNMIRSCKGDVHGVLNGVAMSGGSILLLSCHSVEVMPHSQFMAHTSSGFDHGKLSDKVKSVQSSVKQLRDLYQDVYYGFYTVEEIEDILEGKDSYLEYEEICERLEKREVIIKNEINEAAKKQEAEFEAMFNEPEIPQEALAKLTKAQLISYIKGDVDVVVAEDGSVSVVAVDNEDLE